MKVTNKPANFDAKLQHSIELLQKSETLALRYYDKGFYLAFSGGKDSQALYYVAKLAGVKYESHYSLTTLDPPECARLQTIPNWYKWIGSETQQYKMLGNGWTVEVIKHILSFLPDELKK